MVLKFTQYSVHCIVRRLSNFLMAEGCDSKLHHEKVRQYFKNYVEADTSLVNSLRRENLISDDEKEKILQGSASEKAITCYEIILQNVSNEMIPILNRVLRENDLEIVEDMIGDKRLESDLKYKLGNTIPDFNLHMATMHPSNERLAILLNRRPVNAFNELLTESNIEVYDTQPGCIHIFMHSKEPFYQEMCKENICRIYVEKCLALENVKETLIPNQTITIVIKKNAYSLPLHDRKGKTLEFSKMQVLKINRYYLNRDVSSQVLTRLTPENGRLATIQHQAADIFLDRIKDDPGKEWQTLMCLLREFGNDTMADRLEKMTCAECYRQTIIGDFKNVADEIDTDLMEETFARKSYIPKVVLENCISSKGKLPRLERAKYFLEYVLLKGEVLVSFADVLSSRSKIVLNFTPCEIHGGESLNTAPDTEFTFLVCKDDKDKFYLTTQKDSAGEVKSSDRLNVCNDGGPVGTQCPLKRSDQIDLDLPIFSKKEKLHEHDEFNDIIKGGMA